VRNFKKKRLNVKATGEEVKEILQTSFHVWCPVTSNLSTIMPENIFRKICKMHQEKERASYCNRVCHGKLLPEGLIFAENKKRIGDDMTTYVDGTCQICGLKKSIKKCLDKMACSSCDFIYRSVRNNAERVLELLVETKGKTWVALAAGFEPGEKTGDESKKVEMLEQAVTALQDSLAGADVLAVGYREDLDEKDREIKLLQESLEAARDLPVHSYLTIDTGAGASRDSAVLDLALDILAGKIQGVDVERLQALR